MSKQIILEALNGIHDTYVTEAAEALGLLGEAAPAYTKPAREHRVNLLSRFFGSGWGVAVICAVVSLSVLGGIIWAGQRPIVSGPAGTDPSIETNAETSAETAILLISEERAVEIASAYWNIRTGDVDPDTGYEFRIESLGQTQTPKGEAVYEIALRWLVDGSRYSTVDMVWVDMMTGEVIIPYEDLETETGAQTDAETEIHTEGETETETETGTQTDAETDAETEIHTETETAEHEHTFSEWQTDGTPPCASKRYQYRVCSCGFQEKESIPSEEHVYGEWDVYEPATCYHTGTLYTTCNVCGSKKRQYDAIEKTPHSFEDGYCAVCGLVEGADECFTFRFFNDSNAETVAFIHSREGATGERVILPNVAYDDYTKQIVPVVGLDEGLFSYDETLREIILPDSFDGISKKAFAYCVNLQSIDLPSHIETIGNMAFYGCTSLTEITLPDSVTTIYDEAFAGCTGIIKVNLSDSLLHIGEKVFADCTGITEVNLPDSLLHTGREVFANCTSLTRVTLPVVYFGTGLFSGCSSLTRVDYKGSVSQWTEEMSWHETPLSPTSFTVYCNDGEVVEGQE